MAPPPYSPDLDPETTVLNGGGVREFAVDLAEKICTVLEEGHFPLVLGGDCSILLGSMLALRSRGRFGLVFLDGHLDFRHPGNSGRRARWRAVFKKAHAEVRFPPVNRC